MTPVVHDFLLALKQRTGAAKLPFRLVSSGPPAEVRLTPLALRVDDKHARLYFARELIATYSLSVDRVLAGYEVAVHEATSTFDPVQFFRLTREAYLAALKPSQVDGDRVELTRFFTTLDPRPLWPAAGKYPRWLFAFDVLQLIHASKLTQGGLRLNLGVATGTSALDKRRVVYFEDGDGNGEYKLTIYFTRA